MPGTQAARRAHRFACRASSPPGTGRRPVPVQPKIRVIRVPVPVQPKIRVIRVPVPVQPKIRVIRVPCRISVWRRSPECAAWTVDRQSG
jgi:hypothetical protein